MVSFDVKSLILIFLGIFIFKIAVADPMREKRSVKKNRNEISRFSEAKRYR